MDMETAEQDFYRVDELLGERGEPAYQVATSYAERFQVSKACLWLRRAFQRDPAYITQVRTDPAFDTIREAVEFVRLMAEVSGEEPPPSEGLRGFARRLFG